MYAYPTDACTQQLIPPLKRTSISHIDFKILYVLTSLITYWSKAPSMMNYKVSKQELISIINPTYR
jgi:hypothetical protein